MLNYKPLPSVRKHDVSLYFVPGISDKEKEIALYDNIYHHDNILEEKRNIYIVIHQEGYPPPQTIFLLV